MKYSEQDMATLISEVEAQFAEHLTKSEATKEEEILTKSKKTDVKVSAKAADNSEEIQKSEETEEIVADFDYDEEDIDEMDKMYASMTKNEAEAHYESIQRALGTESSEEVVEPKAEEQVIAKSEEKAETKIEASDDNTESELLKSELDNVKKEKEDLKKSLEKLTTAFTKFVKGDSSAPKQKAITRIEYIQKSEDEVVIEDEKADVSKLSKSEISTRLTQKIREGKLEKTDKQKIDQYYLDGNNNLETIKHLLV